MLDPNDRRYRYPFINCTNCGPRFTIIKDIPYDRPKTTMAAFAMCPDCEREYTDPINRRFHAQPVACPVCGPMYGSKCRTTQKAECKNDDAILEINNYWQGKILAIKGLGGFHLACDATNSKSVVELRQRKLRVDKPFALMMPDSRPSRNIVSSTKPNESYSSPARPIVLLKRKPEVKYRPRSRARIRIGWA